MRSEDRIDQAQLTLVQIGKACQRYREETGNDPHVVLLGVQQMVSLWALNDDEARAIGYHGEQFGGPDESIIGLRIERSPGVGTSGK